MSHKKIAILNACLFFCFWLAVLYAGADHPPPPGFLWVVFADLVCALVVYLRVPAYLNWSLERKKGRFWRALLDGLAAGLVAALATLLVSTGEPGVQPSALDRGIWFVILGIVGMFNAGGIYLFNACIVRWGRRKP